MADCVIMCAMGNFSLSNGNSFNNGDSMSTATRDRNLEPWIFRLMRGLQDRGNI